jgi:hypothetical protein
MLVGVGVALLFIILINIAIPGVSSRGPDVALHSEAYDESSKIEVSLTADRRTLMAEGSIISGEIIVISDDASNNATLEGIELAAFDSRGRVVGRTHIDKIRPGVNRTKYEFETIKTPVVVTMEVMTVRVSTGNTPIKISDTTQKCDEFESRVVFNQSTGGELYGLCHEIKAPTQTP